MAMRTRTQSSLILPLEAADATLDLVGGKGASLAKLAAAGLPVPPGFHLTTAAYRRFVDENDLQASILDAATNSTDSDPALLERAAVTIRALFERGTMPSEIAAAIGRAYAELDGGESAVAVRSSATAEDLPGLSFAGQQETFLNVRGEAALLEAVQRCWASLWTARAIGYRRRMGIAQQAVAMGVVVQTMVPADVSGVLFTANPTTGERTEMLVNASFGLGEAIVAGRVTPDTYTVDKASLATVAATVGAKDTMIVSVDGQGTTAQSVAEPRRGERALPTRSCAGWPRWACASSRSFAGPRRTSNGPWQMAAAGSSRPARSPACPPRRCATCAGSRRRRARGGSVARWSSTCPGRSRRCSTSCTCERGWTARSTRSRVSWTSRALWTRSSSVRSSPR
jgi:rifampicin phosphotransferase